MTRWKPAFIPYFSNSIEECLRVVSKTGYQGLEWVMHTHFKPTDDLKLLAAATKQAGLEIAAIMCDQDFVITDEKVRNERTEMICKIIWAARDAGIRMVNLTTGPILSWPGAKKIGRDISEESAWRSVVSAFTCIIDEAEKNEIEITIEPSYDGLVRDYYTTREFLSYFESKRLGINFDPSHLILYENDPAFAIKRLGRRIKHVHFMDIIGRAGSRGETFGFPMLGEGSVNWKELVSALSEIEYEGYISVEFQATNFMNIVWQGNWEKAALASKEQYDAILKLL